VAKDNRWSGDRKSKASSSVDIHLSDTGSRDRSTVVKAQLTSLDFPDALYGSVKVHLTLINTRGEIVIFDVIGSLPQLAVGA